MNDRLFVAGNTFAGCANVNLIDVAGRTFKESVLSFQRPDQRMIEVSHFAGAIVAGQAVGAKLRGVAGDELGIGLGVAIGTLGAGECECFLAGVAGAAGEWLIVVVGDVGDQAEAGAGGVLKGLPVHQGRLPAIGCMALDAVGAEQAAVSGGFFVAGGTFLRRALELAAVMTGFAGRLGVDAGQDEDLGMVVHGELGHGIQTIMAKKTVAAIGFLMQRDESRASIFVAGGAGGEGDGVVGVADVAGGAGQAVTVIVTAVFCQAEPGDAVVEVGNGRCQQVVVAPPMIQVAGGALFDGL